MPDQKTLQAIADTTDPGVRAMARVFTEHVEATNARFDEIANLLKAANPKASKKAADKAADKMADKLGLNTDIDPEEEENNQLSELAAATQRDPNSDMPEGDDEYSDNDDDDDDDRDEDEVPVKGKKMGKSVTSNRAAATSQGDLDEDEMDNQSGNNEPAGDVVDPHQIIANAKQVLIKALSGDVELRKSLPDYDRNQPIQTQAAFDEALTSVIATTVAETLRKSRDKSPEGSETHESNSAAARNDDKSHELEEIAKSMKKLMKKLDGLAEDLDEMGKTPRATRKSNIGIENTSGVMWKNEGGAVSRDQVAYAVEQAIIHGEPGFSSDTMPYFQSTGRLPEPRMLPAVQKYLPK